MTVKELKTELDKFDDDRIVVFEDTDNGWTNIDVIVREFESNVKIVPSSNREK